MLLEQIANKIIYNLSIYIYISSIFLHILYPFHFSVDRRVSKLINRGYMILTAHIQLNEDNSVEL